LTLKAFQQSFRVTLKSHDTIPILIKSTPKLIKDVENVLRVKKFRSIYGLTETTAAVFQSLADDPNDRIQESVGHLSNHMEAKVIDENGNTVPFGTPGELCLRGYSTMMGYYNDEKKTKEILGSDGWLRTGDQFVLQENGYGKVVGRLKEMIIRGGENLFPREIEDFLNTHPNILETHVVRLSNYFVNKLSFISFITDWSPRRANG
jgi:medium-chain acyl-CoA ligase, mitochondrial